MPPGEPRRGADAPAGGSGCPRCGGPLERRSVLEHEPCGAIRPRLEFEAAGGLDCPDCDVVEAGAFRTVGELFWCPGCEERFDHAASDATDRRSDPPPTGPDPWPWRDRPAAETSRRRQVVSLLTVVGLLTAGIGGAVAVSPYLAPGGARAEATVWQSYAAIVVFRNDDIQPYYRRDAMAAVNRVFVDAGVPVTEGVIPAPDGHPITRSGHLCRYLRRLQRDHPDTFDFELHGYTHQQLTDFHTGSEFGGLPYDEQLRRITAGERILTACLGHRPTVFIPPMDTYDHATVRALAARNFTLVSGGGWFTEEYYNRTSVFEADGLRHLPNSMWFVRNWTTYAFFPTGTLERSFDRAYANGSIYVQMLHYPYFDSPERLGELRALIAHMRAKDDVTFTTLGALAERFRAGTIRRTPHGWELLEPRSGADGAGAGGPLRTLQRWLDGLAPTAGEAEPAFAVDRGRTAVGAP